MRTFNIFRLATTFAAAVLATACFGQSAPVNRAPAQEPAVSAVERAALLELYKSTDGEHWTNHDGWGGAPGTECAWHGVSCMPTDEGASTVRSLYLAENNLRGAVPNAVEQLKHLSLVDLYGNHLSGTLPESVIELWRSKAAFVVADSPQLTNVSEVDYEDAASAILCASHRIILSANGDATRYTELCRKRTPQDRATYCKVEHATIYPSQFATLAWAIDTAGYYKLRKHYSRNVTEGGFVSTRVVRGGVRHEVEDYAEGGPVELWTIERAINGVASQLEWSAGTEIPKCPRWRAETGTR